MTQAAEETRKIRKYLILLRNRVSSESENRFIPARTPCPHPNDPGLSWLSPTRSRRRFGEPMSPERGGQERPESHEEDDRKVRRREKNRVAAQRSRKKQTQKADKLHEEYESLEQENTSLKREIGKLTDEMKHLSEVLKDHEKICPLLHCTMNFMTIPRPDALASCLPR
ncbi:LOW QUALITY PROTEIN: basic leucine zipper transcriptional factor ATF-like 3 [Cinclus cinclus]|uniref:LOW QUALITY PROTEIN: basic leucine zipper transcriptional factor ATF-like 3 n=1 Tax=Cinclus cinclus TaxID=127875 RepID=UPI002E1074D5